MSIGVWTSLIVGILIFAVNLVNGYLQRKLTRHLELYREDPSVGLDPPPHALTLFLRKYGLVIWNAGGAVGLLASGLFVHPPTRISVLAIAAGIGFLLLTLTSRMIEDVYRQFGRIISVLEDLKNIMESDDKILAITVGNVDTLAKTAGILLDNLDLKTEIQKHLGKK